MQEPSILSTATPATGVPQVCPNIPTLESAMWVNLYENVDDPIVAHAICALALSEPQLLQDHKALYLGALVSSYRSERRMLRNAKIKDALRNFLRL